MKYQFFAIQPEYLENYLEVTENVSDQNRKAAHEAFDDKPLPSIITTMGNEAIINIFGPLSPAGPSPIARFFGFGGTGYIDIISAANELLNNDGIKTVYLDMDTPGGTVASMDEAAQALAKLAQNKTVIAKNFGMIASAGYYLATTAKEIFSMSPLAVTGSIGVVAGGLDFTEAMNRMGIKRIKIISSNAPNKQPDPTTPQGVKTIQDEVNAMERVFIRKVAEGRKTTDQNVIQNFGKGGLLIASDPAKDIPDAIKVGMIDGLFQQTPRVVVDNTEQQLNINTITDDGDIESKESITMDLIKLKAEHPALYAQVIGEGVQQERDRVNAHIEMGKASGDTELALKCIADGTEHSPATNAKYMASQMRKSAIDNRGMESEGDLETPASESDEETADKVLAAALAQELGVEFNG